ncbi:Cytochrome P450 [Rhynchospora pubera]|uniref:Cytochrome P450 n=1 Tax=Rhynchospora pubera TaxID=906938 RepID=A0AAV8CDC4_9POAL|nr:Cytochrome P450 [Rhynchospora pubera]
MAFMFSPLFQYLHKLSSLSIAHCLLILTLTSLFLVFVFPHTITTRTRSSNPTLNLPPSPPALPLLGHLHRLSSLPHRSLKNLSSLYGPIMYLHLGSIPAVILSSAAAVEESIRFHDTALSSRPQVAVADILLYGSTDVAFAPYGEYWRQTRRICVSHLLSTKMIQLFGVIREQEVSELVGKIRSVSSISGDVGVNLSQLLFKLANDIVCRAALGFKLSDDGSNRAHSLLKDFILYLGTTLVGEHVPCLGWLDWLTGIKKRMRKTAEGLDSFFETIIEEHVKAKTDSLEDVKYGDQMEGSDLIDVLLNIKENDDDIRVSLSRNNIKAIILDMFAAGTDSVYTTIEWAMAELINNPQEMKRVQDEVRSMVNTAGKLTEELVEKMAYLNAAIKETFRLHPPLVLLVPRESTKDIDLMGYHIPSGTRFIINAWAIGRDLNTWERADEFMPERFLGSHVDYNGQHFGLIPFGVGRRTCPGIGFSTATVSFALASLLHHFDWDLPNVMKGKPLDMSELHGITIHKKLNLILEARPYSI